MIAQLSDLHITPDGEVAAQRAAAAIAYVARYDPQPDAVLLSGDLVDVPSPAAYARVRELLAALGDVPIHAIPGNHDDRDQLRAAFGLGGAPEEPILTSARCGDLRLVACDTVVPGADAGSLDASRLAAIAVELEADRQTPTVLATHHPPALTGVRAMDGIGLPEEDRAALAALLEANPQVGVVACGHAHVPMVSRLGGCPVLIAPSVFLTVELNLDPNASLDPMDLNLIDEPPGVVLHLRFGDAISSHVRPVG